MHETLGVLHQLQQWLGVERGPFTLQGRRRVLRFLARARFHICGRLHKRKKNLRDCIARSQVLTSVRPLLRPFSCRGPVWEFADRVQITATRSKRSVKNWLSDPVSLTVRHTLLSTSYASDAS